MTEKEWSPEGWKKYFTYSTIEICGTKGREALDALTTQRATKVAAADRSRTVATASTAVVQEIQDSDDDEL
jgi:hypothetical protein